MYKLEPEWGFLKIISVGQGLCFEGSSLHVLVISVFIISLVASM